MHIIDSTLEDFGKSMGIHDLNFNNKGLLEIKIEGVGDVFFEKTEDTVVLYMVRPLNYPDSKIFLKAMEFCHPSENKGLLITPGMTKEEELAFMTRLNIHTFTLQYLESTIEKLKELHNRIANLTK